MKTKLLFLSTILFSFSIYAQIDFEAHITVDDTGGTNNPTSVYAADLDGDGDLDMISASANDTKLAWYKNTNGSFGPQLIITENAFRTNKILTADLDNDGDQDLINSTYEGVFWYKNTDGLGNFAAAQPVSTVEILSSDIQAKDMDGDGDIDIISNSGSTNSISWFENMDGQGTFVEEHIITTDTATYQKIDVADLDGDGDMDILTSDYTNDDVGWFKNINGQGDFGPKQIITTNVQRPQGVSAADLDGDGDLDVISTSQLFDHKLVWFENLNGQGNFGPERFVSADVQSQFLVTSADLDNDGDKDILSASNGNDKIAWQENLDGLGNFSAPKTISLQLDYPISVNAADIDGDGDMDVVSESFYDKTVGWFENMDGQGTSFTAHIFNPLNSFPYVTYPMDVDNDGDIDIVSGGDYGLLWYENTNGQGNFGPTQIINNTTICIESVRAADMDNDGLLDLVSADWCTDILFWHKNNGGGNFGPQQTISTETGGSFSITLADLDDDGDQDILASSFGDSSAVWFENIDGQGNFGSLIGINNNTDGAYEVYAKDLDADGDMEVLIASFSSNTVFWHENLGNGNFGPEQGIYSQANYTTCVYADDYNGDGKMDVLATSYALDQIIWFENKGPLSIVENTTDVFSIYPNPTSGLLNIQSVFPVSEITVYNNLGQLLFTSDEKNQVDISTLSKGIYFVKIKNENGHTETKKVVKK